MAAEIQQRKVVITTTSGATVQISSYEVASYTDIISSWDSISSSEIDPQSYETEPGSCSFNVMNDVSVGGYSKFSKIPGLVFAGVEITQNSTVIFKGTIDHLSNIGFANCTVHCIGFDAELSKEFQHTIVTGDNYPNADPDAYGQMLPIIYGSAKRVPLINVVAGAISTLVSDITSSATSIEVSDITLFPATGTFVIGLEKITYTGKSSNTFTGCTRGTSSTDAVSHLAGDGVAEVKSEYFYIAGHAVKSIDNVYVAHVRQDGNYTAYTGQTGDQHATYGDKACIKFTADAVIKRLWNDIKNTGTFESNAGQSSGYIDLPYYTKETDQTSYDYTFRVSSDFENEWAPGFDKTKSTNGYKITLTWEPSITDIGTAGEVKIEYYNAGFSLGSGSWVELFKINAGVVTVQGPQPLVLYIADPYPDDPFRMKITSDSSWDGEAGIYILYCSINLYEYEQPATGGVAYSGNSVAETLLGGGVSIDCDGYQDDGSGTYTGSANALIEQPNHIMKHLLMSRCGKASSIIDSSAYTAAGTLLATGGNSPATPFTIAFALLYQRPNIRTLLSKIAMQSKMVQVFRNSHYIRFLSSPYTADATIYASDVDQNQVWVNWTNKNGIENDLTGAYDYYWSGFVDGLTSLRNIVGASDSGSPSSQNTYGVQTESYTFPYITNEDQAQEVIDWILADLKEPRLTVEFIGGLANNISRKPGEIVAFDVSNSYFNNQLADMVESTDRFLITNVVFQNNGAIRISTIKVN